MASGRLGKGKLSAGGVWGHPPVPAGKITTANLSICNLNNTARQFDVLVRIIGEQNDLTDDYIEYHTKLPPYGVFERTGIVMSANEQLRVVSINGDISIRLHGFEEDM